MPGRRTEVVSEYRNAPSTPSIDQAQTGWTADRSSHLKQYHANFGVTEFLSITTENVLACKSLLEDLIERGVDSTLPTLFVLDGSKALRRAVSEVWGARAIVQRCRAHKKRNVKAHVSDKHWPEVERMLARAWNEKSHARALKQLHTLVSYLDRISPDAANSLREGLEETLTITRLALSPELASHLRTTNPIESAFSITRRLTGRVKRWRDGDMKLRWCATGLVEAEKRFRRIKGYKDIPKLIRALDSLAEPLTSNKKIA